MTSPQPAQEYSYKWDFAVTLILLALLFVFFLLVVTAAGFAMDWVTCPLHPADCNQGAYTLATNLVFPGTGAVFLATTFLCAYRLAIRKRALFIPMFGALAMLACVALSALLLKFATW